MAIGRIGSTDRVGRDQGSTQTERTESAREEMLGGTPLKKAPDQAQSEVRNKKVEEVAKLYEQQFLREMVKAMRSTVSEGGLTKSSMGEKIYRDQMDDQYVESWSAQGGVGFADLIYKQIMDQYFQKPAAAKRLQGQAAPKIVDRDMSVKPLGNIVPAAGSESKPNAAPNGDTGSMQMKRIENSSDVSLLLNVSPARAGQSSAAKLFSPWEGIVSQKQLLPDGRVSLQVRHPEGVDSTFLYHGVGSPLDIGQEVRPEQELAVLSPDTRSLIWNLRSRPNVHT